jgi:hypothetical protein
MEDFISLSEIEMMCTKGGLEEARSTYEVAAPYGITNDYFLPPYGVITPDYGIVIVDPPY